MIGDIRQKLVGYIITTAAVAVAGTLTLGVIFLVDKLMQTLIRLWLGI